MFFIVKENYDIGSRRKFVVWDTKDDTLEIVTESELVSYIEDYGVSIYGASVSLELDGVTKYIDFDEQEGSPLTYALRLQSTDLVKSKSLSRKLFDIEDRLKSIKFLRR